MAQTTVLLNGFSIIGDPQTNTSANDGGQLLIHGGTAVFEADDIIVLTVDDANPDGSLNADSIITAITVYDNATDYFYGTALYTYSAPTGTGGELENGRNGMGDRYLQFDGSPLTSSDPGAPVLGDLTVLAGVDILNTIDAQNGPIKIDTVEDLDLNEDGSITGGEAGDGSFDDDLNILTVICFARGTLIETPDGPRYVESLTEGDLVNTLDAGPQPIRWIGQRSCRGTGAAAPIHFRAGALGNVRDLWVSPNHRMLVAGPHAELLFGTPECLVAAKHLVNDSTIRPMPRPRIDYFHFLLDDHHIVFAEGCAAESLLPGPEALRAVSPENRNAIIQKFPELQSERPGVALSRPGIGAYEATALAAFA